MGYFKAFLAVGFIVLSMLFIVSNIVPTLKEIESHVQNTCKDVCR
jgi:hypothetical protein